jgi:hypothetical protein
MPNNPSAFSYQLFTFVSQTHARNLRPLEGQVCNDTVKPISSTQNLNCSQQIAFH